MGAPAAIRQLQKQYLIICSSRCHLSTETVPLEIRQGTILGTSGAGIFPDAFAGGIVTEDSEIPDTEPFILEAILAVTKSISSY